MDSILFIYGQVNKSYIEVRDKDLRLIRREEIEGTINQKIKDIDPKLIITNNLKGFEEVTLTEHPSYNLLNCRQIHLITEHLGSKEIYLNHNLSLSMFFYCTNKEYGEKIKRKYSSLHSLEIIEQWNEQEYFLEESNIKRLKTIVNYVLSY